ncbi:MAG: hypothetical protein JNL80_07765 [Phycisphaerae bacterium]|jgi:hypothetical protein|nr:hypothetical protein [Phycisphaerae bacterium]
MVSTSHQSPPLTGSALSSGNGPDAVWASRMRSVLDERVALLSELDEASLRQQDVIASRDTQALMALLTARQKIVDRFVAGQSELLSLTETFEAHVHLIDPTEADGLRALLRTLAEGLTRVTTRDEAAQSALRQARDETRGELMKTNSAGGARSAYRATSTMSSRDQGDTNRFADRRA